MIRGECLQHGSLTTSQRSFDMQIFRKLEDMPADFGPSLVSVGNFDGVHRAHAPVLREIVARAAVCRSQGRGSNF